MFALFTAHWPLFASLGPLFAALGPLLGCSRGALGSSWGTLGRSWGGLGALLGALGSLLGALRSLLERHAKIIKKSMPKMTDFGSQKPLKMSPKSHPKPTKNRCKKRSEKKHRNKTVLGPSWGDLGPFCDRSWGHLC